MSLNEQNGVKDKNSTLFFGNRVTRVRLDPYSNERRKNPVILLNRVSTCSFLLYFKVGLPRHICSVLLLTPLFTLLATFKNLIQMIIFYTLLATTTIFLHSAVHHRAKVVQWLPTERSLNTQYNTTVEIFCTF